MATNKLALLEQLRDDMPRFSAECLKIRDKAGSILPFSLNRAQKYIHERLEQQRREKGWVRALVLKGRQQGASTYIAARFYHRAVMHKGVNVFILAHEQAASDNLFDIVDRYQRHNALKPHVGVSNAKELVFDRLESSYVVATAGSKPSGRSRSITLFHGSEAAFWTNAPEHFAASVQTVPLLPGTEIILESTACGPSGEFYERWQDAEAGRGDFIPIFCPWWYSDEYSRVPEPEFDLTTEADEGELSESEYATLFDLDMEQMAWRRAKTIELRDPSLMRQEYPSTPQEAFSRTPGGMEPYISPVSVMRARKREIDAHGPLVIGVDPAGGGGDRFSVAGRRGYGVEFVEYRNKINTQEGVAWVRDLIETRKPARVNIDAGGIGHAVVTGLRQLDPRYADLVRGVNFGGVSEHRNARPKVPGPWNRRAEMWMRLKDWLLDEIGASLPDMDVLQSDICAPREKPRPDNFFLLESKVDMKKRGIRSPDLADAVALTFAFREAFTTYHQPVPKATFADAAEQVHPEPREPAPIFIVPPAGPTSWMG